MLLALLALLPLALGQGFVHSIRGCSDTISHGFAVDLSSDHDSTLFPSPNAGGCGVNPSGHAVNAAHELVLASKAGLVMARQDGGVDMKIRDLTPSKAGEGKVTVAWDPTGTGSDFSIPLTLASDTWVHGTSDRLLTVHLPSWANCTSGTGDDACLLRVLVSDPEGKETYGNCLAVTSYKTGLKKRDLEAPPPSGPTDNGPGSSPPPSGPTDNGPGSSPPPSGPTDNGPGSSTGHDITDAGTPPPTGPTDNGPGSSPPPSGPTDNGPGSAPPPTGPTDNRPGSATEHDVTDAGTPPTTGPTDNGPGSSTLETPPPSGPTDGGPGSSTPNTPPSTGPTDNGPGSSSPPSGPTDNGPGSSPPPSGPTDNGPGSSKLDTPPPSGPTDNGPGSSTNTGSGSYTENASESDGSDSEDEEDTPTPTIPNTGPSPSKVASGPGSLPSSMKKRSQGLQHAKVKRGKNKHAVKAHNPLAAVGVRAGSAWSRAKRWRVGASKGWKWATGQ